MTIPQPRLNAPELLSPAGDWDAMRAAVSNGADAVYFGLRGGNFNARYRATNFSVDELPEVMRYLHGHNVRGYIAFNTLMFSDELEDAVKMVRAIAAARVDALIVQDLGLASLIARLCPGLHVHGSTQMTLTEPLGIEFVRSLGIRRVILARESSLADIRKITAATDLPVEVFIHGALCVSYSGQCLTSEALGGRSANRGQCAQACRLPYELIVDGETRDLGDKAYLLSPQDLAAFDLVDDLATLGVCSLKIEGRLKAAPYVAATTQTYRAAIDASAARTPFRLPQRQELDLAQTFSRGFSHGFFDGVDHQELVHARFPKSRGLRIGKVIDVSPRGVMIETDRNRHGGFTAGGTLSIGDGVVFDEGHPDQPEQGGRIGSVQPRGRGQFEIRFERGAAGRAGLDPQSVVVGAIVWKTDDPAVRKRLESSYARDVVARRVPLTASVRALVGAPLVITVRDDAGHTVEVSWNKPLELAQKFPLTLEAFREQFGRMGESPFELKSVDGVDESARVMVPKSVLNDLRRQAVDRLATLRANADQFDIADPAALESARADLAARFPAPPAEGMGRLHVLVRTMEQLRAALDWTSAETGMRPATVYCDFEDIRQYREAVALARAAGVPIGLATVRVIKPGEEGLLKQIVDCAPDVVLVRNLTGFGFFPKTAPHLPLVADYSLNVANELAAGVLAGRGAVRMVPSYDLNWRQVAAMLENFPGGYFEAVIHQHIPMFHMEHCVFCHTLSTGTSYKDCGRPCDTHRVDLKDRAGASHPLIADVGCRNTVYNAAAQSAAEFVPRMREAGIRDFRVELLRETAEATATLLDRYARVVAGLDDGKRAWRELRVLGQLGVTRGTLE